MEHVTSEVVRSGLYAIAREMKAVMMRTAGSPIIHSGGDASAAVFNAKLELIAQGNDIPTMLGSSILSTRACVEHIGADKLKPGDVIISNDTYLAGGNHQPDIQITRPVFFAGAIVGYVITRGHWTDIGGSSPNSLTIATLDIFGEGLRIPPMLLYRQDVLDEGLVDLIIQNTRSPDVARLDIAAQCAGARIGGERLAEVFAKFGAEAVNTSIESSLDYSERMIRADIATIPDGDYEASAFLETVSGGLWDGKPVPLKVKVTVAGDRIAFDFAGTAPQVVGGINCPFSVTCNSAWYVVKAICDPRIPINQGCYRPIAISAPAGSVVNCSYPASVVQGNTATSLKIVDLILTALSPAIPHRVVAQSYQTTASSRFSGKDPVAERVEKTGRRIVATGDLNPGGFGARPDKDGINVVRAHVGNAGTQSVEYMEHHAPVTIERWEIVPDSGGAGRWRGGCAAERVYRVEYDEAVLSISADNELFAPTGLFGGKPATLYQCIVRHPDGSADKIPAKGQPLFVRKGDRVHIQAAGGGGYGEPQTRDRELLRQDVRNGYVSDAAARHDYGQAEAPAADDQTSRVTSCA
jgi:N-methylhydantoinase B